MLRKSQYVASVPMLTRQWIVEGYIWQCGGPCDQLPEDVKFVAVLPDHSTLVSTASPAVPLSAAGVFTPWKVIIYSDAAEQTPLAVLDTLGHYAQIESFSVPLTDDEPEDPDTIAAPSFCRFLCGETTGELHICPD